MKYGFLKVLLWKELLREFDLWNVFNELDLLSVQVIESNDSVQAISAVFMNLIFSLFVIISYGKNRL